EVNDPYTVIAGYTPGIAVIPAAATQLAVTLELNLYHVDVGALSVVVNAEDPYGNIDPNFNGDITIALDKNPNAGILRGTLTVPARFGTAIFNDVTLSHSGSGYTLKATGPGPITGISSAFDLPDSLVVTTQPPSSVMAGTPFELVVSVEYGPGEVDT